MTACARCGRPLSRYADQRDVFCAPCHPLCELEPAGVLAAVRWHPDTAAAPHEAAVHLARRRWSPDGA